MRLEEMIEVRILELLQNRPPTSKKAQFMEYTTRKWALREIMNDLRMKHTIPFVVSDVDIVLSFKAKMDRLKYLNPNTSLRFSIASEVAEELIASMSNNGGK